jgi:hypothetical protein
MRSSRIRRWLIARLTACLVVASVSAGQTPATGTLTQPEQALDRALKVETIREITSRLAAPDMEGRGAAQPGGD